MITTWTLVLFLLRIDSSKPDLPPQVVAAGSEYGPYDSYKDCVEDAKRWLSTQVSNSTVVKASWSCRPTPTSVVKNNEK